MTEKIWLKNYDSGVPATINPDEYSSLAALIEDCCQKYGNKTAFINMDVSYSFKEIDELSRAFAGFLQKKCQLKAGERVAIMLPNLLQYPVVLFGILRAGLIVVNVNPLYTPRELHHILEDSGAKCIIVLENFAHVVEQALPGTALEQVIVTEVGDLLGFVKGKIANFMVRYVKKMIPPWKLTHVTRFKDTIKPSYAQDFIRGTITGDDIAFLQYTGGTTGVIKAAILTHRNIVANVLQASAWVIPLKKEMKHGILTALPMYHIFSLTANCLDFFMQGYHNVLITNPRDITGLLKTLRRHPISIMTGVNTLFNAMNNHPEFANLDFSSLKFVLGGGMAMQKPVADKWQQLTKGPIIQAYGLTEASPGVTINPVTVSTYTGSIGLPIPSTEVKICDENGDEVPLGEQGELWVRGPQVMRGYWNQPVETQKVLTADGWLRTGDMARMDNEGFVFLVDRKKDLIIVSGFNVYPTEIEGVILEMQNVLDVAVIGVPSKQHGEIVKAFIVPKSKELTAEQVIAHCKQQLTGYKIPKEIEFRTELPKSNVGKVLRRVLREEEETKRNQSH